MRTKPSVSTHAPKGKAKVVCGKSVPLPRISRPDRFKDIAGCLSDADAKELTEIIEAGCEKVDTDAW